MIENANLEIPKENANIELSKHFSNVLRRFFVKGENFAEVEKVEGKCLG